MVLSSARWAQVRRTWARWVSPQARLTCAYVCMGAGCLSLMGLPLALPSAHAETLGMRRPPAFVGRVQTEAVVDPAAVVQQRASQQGAPIVSTATQVAPPVDPDEPLFRASPHDGVPEGAKAAPPPPLAHNAQTSPRMATKASGRLANKASVVKGPDSRKPVMKAAGVLGAKMAAGGTRVLAKRSAKQTSKPLAITSNAKAKTKLASAANAARRGPKLKSGGRVAAAKQASRPTTRRQKAKASTSGQARAAQPPSSKKQPRRTAVSRKQPQARRVAAVKAG